MNCHICKEPSVGQCQSCWKFYCSDHGDVLCQVCKEKAPGWAGLAGFGGGGFIDVLGGRQLDEPPPDMEAMMKASGIPMKRVLLRVVPVVQTQTLGESQLAVVSLELYDDAFVAHVRVKSLQEQQPGNRFFRMPAWPQINFEASDDTGEQYVASPGGGGGSDTDYRFEVNFTPAIGSEARAITLIAPEVQWMAQGPGQRSRIEPGPWRFEIPLT